jgi:putative peptidoglycan lipid II flippase
MKKATFLIIILTIISKIVGFSREIILSYFYGTSGISDAYLISLTVPQTLFVFIGTGIGTGYIPIYSSIEKDVDVHKADSFANNVINTLLIFSTIIVILGIIFVEPLVKVFASGFQGNTFELAVTFTKVSLIGVYFSGLTYIFSSHLQLKNNFFAPALMGIPLNILIIASIVLSIKTNTLVLVIGTVIASFAQMLFLLVYMKKAKFRYKPILDFTDKYIRKMAYLALPVIIGVSVNQLNVLIDRTIASQIVEGGISALNYANRLNLFIQGIFVMSIATVMYPQISRMVSENNIQGLKKILSESINIISLLVIPITLGSMIFSNEIVELLFERGAFDNIAVSLTSSSLFFYSIGMLGFGLREVLSRAFYSMQDTKTPMINAAIGMLLNIILNIVLSRYLGIGGLALATSIAAIFTTVLLFINLYKKIGPFGIKRISITLLKILFTSIIMGIIAKFSFNYFILTLSQNLSLFVAISIGAVSYFAIIYFMKIEDVDVLVQTIKKKFRIGTF